MTSVLGPSASSQYTYNGLGDRLSQNGVNYTLDLNAGLTQVLDDGTNTYTYGLGRISQQSGITPEYFLGDALGSVRQLVNNTGEITLTNSYDPYGKVLSSTGSGSSVFAYTGEQQDASGLTYLRARYYNPVDGRFVSRDTWEGDESQPITYNKWAYANANPIYYVDPSGNEPISIGAGVAALALLFARGAIPGAIVGGWFGNWSYEPAIAGQCGCQMQQEALLAGKQNWTLQYALMGGIVGGVVSLATIFPLTTIAVGGWLVKVAYEDIRSVIDVVYNEGVGWTKCNIVRAGFDVAAFIFGGASIIKGLRAWKASGNLLSWKTPGVPISATQLLYEISKPGNSFRTRNVYGENPLTWFNRIAKAGTVKSHPNPIQSLAGGLIGEVEGGGTIQYRPVVGPRSGGYPSIELQNVAGFINKLIYHFHP